MIIANLNKLNSIIIITPDKAMAEQWLNNDELKEGYLKDLC